MNLDRVFDVRDMIPADVKLRKKSKHGHAQSGLDRRIQQGNLRHGF